MTNFDPHTYRAPMRSRLFDDAAHEAVERALMLGVVGVVGVGGRLSDVPPDSRGAITLTRDQYDERTAARLERFVAVPVGAVVWTRDGAGLFHRGVVTGQWRYDGSAAAHEVDLVHVRRCDWGSGPLDPEAAVLATFARGGRNFQRIRDAEKR